MREFVQVLAAGWARLGGLPALIPPLANAEMMTLFLAPGARQFAPSFVLLLVGRAGWHTTPCLVAPGNIRWLPQPARSPELTPPEHVWEGLREKTPAHRACAALRPLEHTPGEGLSHLAGDPQRVRSLADFPSLRVPF